MKDSRKRAMKWWNSLHEGQKKMLCRQYWDSRIPSTLTGREIEYMLNNLV